ncbi:MAG: hypothetical protein F4Y03_07900 [Alphaproteobacteria bacterium]|nr:hypothetical protein [Alphaproteobacteria bacterium]
MNAPLPRRRLSSSRRRAGSRPTRRKAAISGDREFSPPEAEEAEVWGDLLRSFLRGAVLLGLAAGGAGGGLYYLYYLMSTGQMEHFPLVCGAIGLE